MSESTEIALGAGQLRGRFLEAAMRVLARDGYSGFKQSAVCAEIGLTTGGFYHSFPSWKDFEVALIEHWQRAATADVVSDLRAIGRAEDRVVALKAAAHTLPHCTERALRVWAAKDPAVAAAVEEVDQTRRAVIAEFIADVVADPDVPDRFAAHSILLLVGYQCSTINEADFEAAMAHIVDEVLTLPRRAAN